MSYSKKEKRKEKENWLDIKSVLQRKERVK